jgi:predicted RNase H-like HicB family nuclease
MPANERATYVIMPSEQAGWLVTSAMQGFSVIREKAETITLLVRQLPEGVWLTMSDDLPGLIVETETRDEAIDLARELALDLLEVRGLKADRHHQKFAFIYQQ